MAKIVTIRVLIDSDIPSEIFDGLNEALRPLTMDPIDEYGVFCIDYAFDSELRRIPAHIEDSIVNETYEEGDAFK
jgi:hypothetical protein